jgi:hypothetical protein
MDHCLEIYGNPYVSIYRKITISCDTFGGFTCEIDVNAFNTKQEIINNVLGILENKLAENCFNALTEQLNKMRELYHIHDYSFDDILNRDLEYYICNHNCQST